MDIQWIFSMDIERIFHGYSDIFRSAPYHGAPLFSLTLQHHRRHRPRSQNFSSSRIDALKLAEVDSSKARGDRCVPKKNKNQLLPGTGPSWMCKGLSICSMCGILIYLGVISGVNGGIDITYVEHLG